MTEKLLTGTLNLNTTNQPIYKRWDEVTRKVVWNDQDENMGRVVPDEMSWYEMAVQELDLRASCSSRTNLPPPFKLTRLIILQY